MGGQERTTKEQVIERMAQAHIEWMQEIWPNRHVKFARLKEVQAEWKRIHREAQEVETHEHLAEELPEGRALVQRLIDLEDEEGRIKKDLEPEETAWKQKYGFEIERDAFTNECNMVGYYAGGVVRNLSDELLGWSGDVIKVEKEMPKKREDGPDVERIQPSKRYL